MFYTGIKSIKNKDSKEETDKKNIFGATVYQPHKKDSILIQRMKNVANVSKTS